MNITQAILICMFVGFAGAMVEQTKSLKDRVDELESHCYIEMDKK